MTEKFTIEDLFIRIIPGGVLIGILFLIYRNSIDLKLIKELDFFYTFLFFTFSFLVGEILQTIAHQLECIIYIFFKFYKPSEVFLYKDNPVIKNNRIRQNLIKYLSLPSEEIEKFNKNYKELPILWWKREKQNISQSYFWKLYSNISNDNEIKVFNRSYLFIRAITVLFIFFIILFYIEKNTTFTLTSLILFILFLWRARGMARMLVFKTVLLNLRDK